MADPGLIYSVALQHKEQLLRMELTAANEMVRAYGSIWQRLRQEIEALIEAAGDNPSPSAAYEHGRMEALLAQAEREMARFTAFVDAQVQREQQIATRLAERNTEILARLQAKEAGVRIGTWERLPTDAIESLVGFTRNGSPLRVLFNELGADAQQRIRDGILQGLAMGNNPREVARNIRAELGGNLGRALTIARTEMLRSAREAAHQSQLAHADLLDGWQWLAAKQGRTCPMCLAMDGSFHPLEERLNDHPNGRCTAVPCVKGVARLSWQTGAQWFAQQDEKTQRQVLGSNAAMDAFKAGTVSLNDFIGQRTTRDWGTTRQAKSLTQILNQ